jgi:hypothetical protein
VRQSIKHVHALFNAACCLPQHQAELAKPDANFAGALDIYNNARIAKRDDGTPRTM